MEPDETKLDQDVLDGRADSVTPPLHMKAEGSPKQDIFSKHRPLVDWVLENDGYFHPDAQIAFSSRKGFHVLVSDGKTIAHSTRIAGCPMPLTLSVLNALDITPFSNHGSKFPLSFLLAQATKPESLQSFFLMEQLILGNKSWWAPYIDSLPTVQDVNDLQFGNEGDLLWLEGTNLKGGLATQADKWHQMYEHGLGHLKQVGWSRALDGSYTWERFRWAATIYGSRSFTSEVLHDTLPAERARLNDHFKHPLDHRQKAHPTHDLVTLFSERFGVLLPLLDLLNHKPGVQVEWLARNSFVGLQVLQTYGPGQELCNNYGPKDNEGLLLAYGFTIQKNPFDHFVISIRLPPGSPLTETRTWKKDLRSDPEHRCFIFDYQHPSTTSAVAIETSVFSFDLLDSISVLCANEREQEIMHFHRQTLMSRFLPMNGKPCFEDGRNILATLSQFLLDCSARVKRLKDTDPAHSNPAITTINAKQKNAKVYRESQLNIVETAAAVCTYVLKGASQEGKSEDILAGMQQDWSESIYNNLQALVRRYPIRLTRPFELLTSASILDMLHQTLSTSLLRCIKELESNLNGGFVGTLSRKMITEKSSFALILSALYSELNWGVKLPHRVKSWVEQLSEWYPLEQDSWAYVPKAEDEAPAALMSLLASRAALSSKTATESSKKQWLRPDRICWGWNVMEEQVVQVPTRALQPRSVAATEEQDPITVLLYWEQC